MERLTERSKTGTAFFDDDGALIRGAGGAFRQKKDMTANFIHQRFVALDKAIDRLAAYEDTMPLERAQELAQAEKDGRLVVLPCKKGDTLWSYYDYPTCGISKIAVTAVSTLDGITVINTDNYGMIEEEDIGKTVFLTREEVEAALKKEGGRQ